VALTAPTLRFVNVVLRKYTFHPYNRQEDDPTIGFRKARSNPVVGVDRLRFASCHGAH